MKLTAAAALVAAATGATTQYGSNGTVIVTRVVSSYVTTCTESTSIVHGSKTYTVTEPTVLTITDCPCTVSMPVAISSTVVCDSCSASPSHPVSTAPAVSFPSVSPGYTNSTMTAGKPTAAPSSPVTPPKVNPPADNGVSPPASRGSATNAPVPVPTAGAAKAAALSGAGLVGVVGFVALML